ncbi:MAG: signal peptidase II [Myxococcaceae bacterium]
MRPGINKYALLLALGVLTVAADQVSKYLAVARLTTAMQAKSTLSERIHTFYDQKNPPARHSHSVVPSYWDFRYVENPGAAWGMLADLPPRVREPFFHVVSLLAIAFIGWLFRGVDAGQRLLQVALSLVMGGALGNVIDRVCRGYVIDFIDWHWRSNAQLRWPTFNVADAAICVGVTLMLLESLRARNRAPEVAAVSLR